MLSQKKILRYYILNRFFLEKTDITLLDAMQFKIDNTLIKEEKILKILNKLNIFNRKPVKLIHWKFSKKGILICYSKFFNVQHYLNTFFLIIRSTSNSINNILKIKKNKIGKNNNKLLMQLELFNFEFADNFSFKEQFFLNFIFWKNNFSNKFTTIKYLLNIL